MKKESAKTYKQRFCACGTQVFGQHRLCAACRGGRKREEAAKKRAARAEEKAARMEKARRLAAGPCSGLTYEDVEMWT